MMTREQREAAEKAMEEREARGDSVSRSSTIITIHADIFISILFPLFRATVKLLQKICVTIGLPD